MEVYEHLCRVVQRRDRGARLPSCDMAADAQNTKVRELFISRVYGAGCKCTDLFAQGDFLKSLRDPRDTHLPALLYCNPPFVLMARVLAFIDRFALVASLVAVAALITWFTYRRVRARAKGLAPDA